jgi:hypothetical protein
MERDVQEPRNHSASYHGRVRSDAAHVCGAGRRHVSLPMLLVHTTELGGGSLSAAQEAGDLQGKSGREAESSRRA